MNWYLAVINNYAGFRGRARRKEYWYFTLFNTVFAIVALILDNVAGLTVGEGPYGYLSAAYTLGVLVPGLAVLIRRLHDIGKSGWFCLVYVIPLIGPIVLFVFTVMDSESGENQYGPDPKEAERGGTILSLNG